MVVVWQVVETIALRTTPGDRALSDAPPDIAEFPVEITLYDGHGTLGGDRGFVWIEDGLLTFNGTACSFVVASTDVYRWGEHARRDLPSGVPKGALHLRTPGRMAFVQFRPLSGLAGLSFDYRLGRFLASLPTSVRPRQWPPSTSYRMQPTVPGRAFHIAEATDDAAGM